MQRGLGAEVNVAEKQQRSMREVAAEVADVARALVGEPVPRPGGVLVAAFAAKLRALAKELVACKE